MKKLILLISILFLVVNLSGAKIIEVPEAVGGVGLIGGGTPAASCSSGSVDATSTDGTDILLLATAKGYGQSFQVTSNGTLYSIELYLEGYGNGTATMRWGPDLDLSDTQGTYYGEVQITNIASGYHYEEFVFADTTNNLSTGITYYLGVMEDTNDIATKRNDSGTYANGNYKYGNGFDWDLDIDDAAKDLNFKVNLCD